MNRLIIPLTAVLIITFGSGICYASAGKSTPTITWSNPADIIYGTALNSTQLNASASVPGTFVYNPPAGTVLGAGTRILHVDFTPTDTANYYNASKDVTINVQKSTPTISWTAPSPITYGTALSSTQLSATSPSTAGSFAYNPASGIVLGAGTKTLNVTFTPTDSTNYTTATGSVSLSINQAIPTISWTAPSPITYGTALNSTQLNATCPTTSGTFAYNPASGTVLEAGTKTLNVTFTPTDSTNYTTANGSVSLTVNQATPTITWSNPADIVYGTALNSTQLDAFASVPGALVYSPTNGIVLGAGTQTLHVDFTPNDAANYSNASKNVTLNVTKENIEITWSNPADIVYGTALNSSQLNASASVPGTLVYNPAEGTVLSVGTQTLYVDFTPEDTANYSNASKSVTVNVLAATPEITWSNPADIIYGTTLNSTQLNASASVPGTFVYNPPAGTVLGAGTRILHVDFTPTDTANYYNASKDVTINVQKSTPTISWTAPSPITYGTALSGTQLSATSPSTAGSFAYNPVSGTVLGAGTKTLDVTFTPTDSTNYSTASKDVSITVQKETPTIIWSNPADIIYETALNSTQLNASASVAGTFDYAPISGTVLSAGAQTLHVDFTPTDAANYSTPTKNVTINVIQANPVITWSNPSDIIYGTALNSTQLNASASVSGTFTYNPLSGTVLGSGTQTLHVDFTPENTANYTNASKNVTLNVSEQPVIPAANFSTNVTGGYAPLSVQFNDSSDNATGWNWDFGDGNNSTEPNPMHTYSSVGNYTVNLTASNENGTNSMFATITVLEQPAPAYIINKTVTDVAGQGPAGNVTKAGDVISYQINVSNVGNIDLTNITVKDPLINLTGPIESKTTDGILEVGENWTYTGTYTVTQENLNNNGG